MSHQVQLAPAAFKQLEKLPRRDQLRIRDVIDELSLTPRPPGVKKLTGGEDLWRVRVGDYRILYQIQDEVLMVLVVRIAHRRDVYRGGGK